MRPAELSFAIAIAREYRRNCAFVSRSCGVPREDWPDALAADDLVVVDVPVDEPLRPSRRGGLPDVAAGRPFDVRPVAPRRDGDEPVLAQISQVQRHRGVAVLSVTPDAPVDIVDVRLELARPRA